MASLAFFAVLPLMLVDLETTSHTFMRRSFIAARVSMAFTAFHIRVLALESKTSLFERVIEFCFFPITLVMAVFTIGAQTTLVFINLTMTGIAVCRRFTIFFLRLVTIFALYFFLLLV